LVTVRCDPRAFRLWNSDSSSWTTPPGGTLLLARGLGDVRLELLRGQAPTSDAGAAPLARQTAP
jgi:hypothetical protein